MAKEIAGGISLRKKLLRSERRKKFEAIGLIGPLFLVMALFYFVPIALMLFRSIDNSQMSESLPMTAEIIDTWSGEGLPDEEVYAAIVADMKIAQKDLKLARVGRRLNFDLVGYYSLLSKTGNRLDELKSPPYKAALIEMDKKWGQERYWTVLERGLKDTTMIYLLAALDLKYDDDNKISKVPQYEAIYVSIITRTVYISISVTILCLLLGFPVAYYMATAKARTRNLLMIMLLLVFWTSLLVRTLSWILVLQNNGVVNGLLMSSGLISQPLELVFNRIGVYIAMTHVLLPFMVLPLYSVMRSIPPDYVRAATSLGAKPITAFIRVYLPQTLPGIGAGALMVFIQALGYYITPALVGGPRDQMVSFFVAFFVNERVNWSMASSLGVTLLILTGSLYLIFGRRVNISNMKMG
ncbi:MAG: ABC transporter permease [Rhizobiaceae bacterium]|nr:ABC transporter permease [Rhizobiaceae bacterium]